MAVLSKQDFDPFDVWPIHMKRLGIVEKKRGVLRSPVDTDRYVANALALFSPSIYKATKGWTRRGGGRDKLAAALFSYDRPDMPWTNWTKREHELAAIAWQRTEEAFTLKDKSDIIWFESVPLDLKKSSGWPYFKPKGDVLKEIYSDSHRLLHYMKRRNYSELKNLPYCTVGMRGHLSRKEEAKTRLVWMYPASITALEGMFMHTHINAFNAMNPEDTPIMTGKNAINAQARLASQTSRLHGIIAACLDFKQYDASFKRYLMRKAAEITMKSINWDYVYDPKTDMIYYNSQADIDRYQKVFWNLIEYAIFTPILTPSGIVYQKNTGMPSGSMFTNILESKVTRFLMEFISLYFSFSWKEGPCTKLSNGDDSAGITHKRTFPSLDRIAEMLKKYFDITLNTKKSVLADRPEDVYMSGAFWDGLSPVRDGFDLFLLATYSKSYVTGMQVSLSRMLGVLIAGGYRNPLFCEFFEFYQTCYPFHWDPEIIYKELPWVYKTIEPHFRTKFLDQKISVLDIILYLNT